jgi:hypothetical protein
LPKPLPLLPNDPLLPLVFSPMPPVLPKLSFRSM